MRKIILDIEDKLSFYDFKHYCNQKYNYIFEEDYKSNKCLYISFNIFGRIKTIKFIDKCTYKYTIKQWLCKDLNIKESQIKEFQNRYYKIIDTYAQKFELDAIEKRFIIRKIFDVEVSLHMNNLKLKYSCKSFYEPIPEPLLVNDSDDIDLRINRYKYIYEGENIGIYDSSFYKYYYINLTKNERKIFKYISNHSIPVILEPNYQNRCSFYINKLDTKGFTDYKKEILDKVKTL